MPLDIPDTLLDDVFGGEDTMDAEVALEDVAESPEELDEDTLDLDGLDSDEGSEDTDEQESESVLDGEDEGDEDAEEESPEEQDESATEDTDEDEEESFLPEFDRKKFLAEHPELEPAYKHFQAAFTKAQQAVRAREREVEEVATDYEQFAATLKDDAGCQDFLIQLALRRPEVFQSAVDQVLTLNDDEGERESYLLKKENEQLKGDQKKQRERQEREQVEARINEIVSVANTEAEKLGLSEKATAIAHERVANAIRRERERTGKADVPNERVKEIVADLAEAIEAARKEARESATREQEQRRLAAAKAKAREQKRPVPKAGGSARKAKPPTKGEESKDPREKLSSRLDELLS